MSRSTTKSCPGGFTSLGSIASGRRRCHPGSSVQTRRRDAQGRSSRHGPATRRSTPRPPPRVESAPERQGHRAGGGGSDPRSAGTARAQTRQRGPPSHPLRSVQNVLFGQVFFLLKDLVTNFSTTAFFGLINGVSPFVLKRFYFSFPRSCPQQSHLCRWPLWEALAASASRPRGPPPLPVPRAPRERAGMNVHTRWSPAPCTPDCRRLPLPRT